MSRSRFENTEKRLAIQAAARHVYEASALWRGKRGIVGWVSEPQDVKEEWIRCARETINAYEKAMEVCREKRVADMSEIEI
jgi:hypothetical protein